MEKNKPRLAEVLGVKVWERFKVKDSKDDIMGPFCINSEGVMVYAEDPSVSSDEVIYTAINHPESVIRAPRLTEAELAICKAVGAKWVSRDSTENSYVYLWDAKPKYSGVGYGFKDYNGNPSISVVYNSGLFPSIHLGDCINVEAAGSE